jgi:hypothetical protein
LKGLKIDKKLDKYLRKKRGIQEKIRRLIRSKKSELEARNWI